MTENAPLDSITDVERFFILKNNRGVLKKVAKRARKSPSTVSRVFNGKYRNDQISAHLEKHIGPLLAKLRKTGSAGNTANGK